MLFKDKYKIKVMTEDEIAKQLNNNYKVINQAIRRCDIKVIAHFGNVVSLSIHCDNVSPIVGYNNTKNLGCILQVLTDLFDKNEEDGFNINKLVDTPIRVIFDNENVFSGRCVAIGNFIQDQFVMVEDLLKL